MRRCVCLCLEGRELVLKLLDYCWVADVHNTLGDNLALTLLKRRIVKPSTCLVMLKHALDLLHSRPLLLSVMFIHFSNGRLKGFVCSNLLFIVTVVLGDKCIPSFLDFPLVSRSFSAQSQRCRFLGTAECNPTGGFSIF